MMTDAEIQEKREALAESLLELRKNQGWLFIVDQILDMRSNAIEDCKAAAFNNTKAADRMALRASMKLAAIDELLDIMRENIEFGIIEEEKHALGI